jgi:CO/xanthine dehydrogenase Mo-binding subunit
MPVLLTTPESRVEGRLKVTGEAAFAGDFSRPGMLWAAFRRSDVPHARIASIDVSRALNEPGVHAVLTARDIGSPRFGRRLLDQPVLADDKVRFVGERVAAVAADTREAAEEAAQWIRVDYEELPAVFDAEEALASGAPILHEGWRDYVFLGGERQAVPHANIQGHRVARKGEANLESVFARAWRTYEHTFSTPRQHHGYVEPHASLSWIDESGLIHVVSTNKTPFLLRGEMAAVTDAPEELIDIDSGPMSTSATTSPEKQAGL